MTPQPVADQIEFRKTVTMGLNALTQNFVQQRMAFTLEAMAEAGLDPKEWQPNFEQGIFVSIRQPIMPDAAVQPSHAQMFDRNGVEPAHMVEDDS